MVKPNGLSIQIVDGGIAMRIPAATKTEDLIWEAVEDAIAAGWTAKRFTAEAAAAWDQYLRDAARDAAREFDK